MSISQKKISEFIRRRLHIALSKQSLFSPVATKTESQFGRPDSASRRRRYLSMIQSPRQTRRREGVHGVVNRAWTSSMVELETARACSAEGSARPSSYYELELWGQRLSNSAKYSFRTSFTARLCQPLRSVPMGSTTKALSEPLSNHDEMKNSPTGNAAGTLLVRPNPEKWNEGRFSFAKPRAGFSSQLWLL